jgi:hypothetical protein
MVYTSLEKDYTMCGAWNYVAKLSAAALRPKDLKPLGHIFYLAT